MRLRYALLYAVSGVALSLPVRAQAPAAQEAPPPENPAARRALDGIPLVSPEMMEELARRVRRMQETQESVTNPVVAQPLNRMVTVTLRPGDPSPVINTVRGYPTSITFTDITGQPWPIHWEMVGNPNQPGSTDCKNSEAQAASAANGAAIPAAVFSTGFNVCVPVKGGSTLMITALGNAPRGGLQVILEGAAAPIPFQLIGLPDRYDSVVTVRVARRGPNARLQMFTAPEGVGPVTGDADLMAMLDGTPPAKARPLLVRGAPPDGAQAWSLGGHTFLRIAARVVSPQPISRHYLGDLGIYELPDTPVVLATSNGQTFSLGLETQDR